MKIKEKINLKKSLVWQIYSLPSNDFFKLVSQQKQNTGSQ